MAGERPLNSQIKRPVYMMYISTTKVQLFPKKLISLLSILTSSVLFRHFQVKDWPDMTTSKKYSGISLMQRFNTTPVMIENPSWQWRTTQVFERGNFRTLGKVVEPAVPNSLSFAMPANAPKNRLGLACGSPIKEIHWYPALWLTGFGSSSLERG